MKKPKVVREYANPVVQAKGLTSALGLPAALKVAQRSLSNAVLVPGTTVLTVGEVASLKGFWQQVVGLLSK